MKSKVRSVVLTVAILMVPCLLVLLMEKHNRHKESQSDKELGELLEKVYFEGDVISSPVYKYSTLLCIRIDTASVDTFYYFSRDWALCIRESVAVMPIGMVDENDSSDQFRANAQRVIVNKDYSGKTLFVKGSDTLTENLSLWPGKLDEVHMLMAWEDAVSII